MTWWNLAQEFKGLKAIRRRFPDHMGGAWDTTPASTLHFLETPAMQTKLSFTAYAPPSGRAALCESCPSESRGLLKPGWTMPTEREKSTKAMREQRRQETDKVAAEMIDADLREKRERTERLRRVRLAAQTAGSAAKKWPGRLAYGYSGSSFADGAFCPQKTGGWSERPGAIFANNFQMALWAALLYGDVDPVKI
jgi:hypothetical protein